MSRRNDRVREIQDRIDAKEAQLVRVCDEKLAKIRDLLQFYNSCEGLTTNFSYEYAAMIRVFFEERSRLETFDYEYDDEPPINAEFKNNRDAARSYSCEIEIHANEINDRRNAIMASPHFQTFDQTVAQTKQGLLGYQRWFESVKASTRAESDRMSEMAAAEAEGNGDFHTPSGKVYNVDAVFSVRLSRYFDNIEEALLRIEDMRFEEQQIDQEKAELEGLKSGLINLMQAANQFKSSLANATEIFREAKSALELAEIEQGHPIHRHGVEGLDGEGILPRSEVRSPMRSRQASSSSMQSVHSSGGHSSD